MAMEILTAIIPTIIDYTIRPVARQVGYIIFYKSNLEDLRSKLEDFDSLKKDRKREVDEVGRKVDHEVKAEVKKWLSDAENTTREADALLHDEDRAKTKCLIICPNLIYYHQRSRKSTKLVEKIEAHKNKNKEFSGSSLSYEVHVEDVSAIASDEYMTFESRISMVKDIITELKKTDISRIGVYGLGGVGKTTLAKEVRREAVKDQSFDDVVIVLNVKEKKDEQIQKEIAEQLKMDINESPKMGKRANLLRAGIKDKKTLIILDDVLEIIDFEAMGLVGVPTCNLLLTSRDQTVLSEMGMQKCRQLGLLSEEETWSLFEKMAGDVVKKDDRIRKVATELAKRCGGLPVSVVAVAKASKENSRLEVWKDALRRFKRFDKEDIARRAIKWSYNQLKGDELRPLFLLCGVIAGRRCQFFFNDLFKYSMGLGLIKDVDTVEEARNSLHALAEKLKNSCLLLNSNDDMIVRMHELVRDAAIWIASDDQKAFSRGYGDEVKEWPTEDFLKKCTRMSLNDCKIPRLPEVPWECPKLKLLILSDNYQGDSQEIPSKFFEGMKELEVLDVSGIRIPLLPPSLLSLKHLQTLCLDRCELADITLVGQLTKLKILSLLKSKIEELPKEIGQLTSLQLLDLSGCSELVLISPGVISSLTRLEDLRMGSFKQWEGEGLVNGTRSNASVSELKHLSHLSALDIHVPDADLLPTNLFSDKLERYTILIGDCWEYPNIFATSSKMLKLKLTRRNQFDGGIKSLVERCEQLYLDGMESVNIISYLFDSEAVKQLKHLHVQNNDEVKYVINSVNWSYSHNAFSNLESLALEDLVSLESVCYGQLIGEPFRKLKSLTMWNLPKFIGFSSQGKQQVTIDSEANEIVSDDKVGGPPRLFNNEEVLISNLTTLIVHQCDSLRFLFSSSTAKCLGQLKHLTISKCQALQMVYDTSYTTQVNGFECPNLNSVEIDSCDSLKNVFPASVAKDLKQLSKLEVKNCDLLKEIVMKKKVPETTYEEFEFPKVTFMEFHNLPQLGSFYPGLHVSNWPSLNFLKFTECGGVEILPAKFSTYQDKLDLGHPRQTKQPFFFIEKNKSFLNLEFLVLDENTEIVYGPLPAELLRKLKGIGFATSRPQSDVFFENLQNIEELCVFSAPWKELIVHDHQGSSSGEIHEVKTLPRVKILWLRNMPELILLGKENSQPGGPVFPNLEFLCLEKCGRLENLTSTLISFRNLITLTILDCQGLQYLIPYSVAKNLQQLKSLVVESCKKMVEIVASNEDDSETEITFSCLQHLKLSDLPSLQGFCTGNCIFKVPSLPTLIVEDCQLIKLKISLDGLLQSDARPERLQIEKETDDALKPSDSRQNDRDQTEQPMIAD